MVINERTDLSLRYLTSPSASIFTIASSMNTDVKKKLRIFRANSNSCKTHTVICQSFNESPTVAKHLETSRGKVCVGSVIFHVWTATGYNKRSDGDSEAEGEENIHEEFLNWIRTGGELRKTRLGISCGKIQTEAGTSLAGVTVSHNAYKAR